MLFKNDSPTSADAGVSSDFCFLDSAEKTKINQHIILEFNLDNGNKKQHHSYETLNMTMDDSRVLRVTTLNEKPKDNNISTPAL